MNCDNCNYELQPDWLYCPACGRTTVKSSMPGITIELDTDYAENLRKIEETLGRTKGMRFGDPRSGKMAMMSKLLANLNKGRVFFPAMISDWQIVAEDEISRFGAEWGEYPAGKYDDRVDSLGPDDVRLDIVDEAHGETSND